MTTSVDFAESRRETLFSSVEKQEDQVARLLQATIAKEEYSPNPQQNFCNQACAF